MTKAEQLIEHVVDAMTTRANRGLTEPVTIASAVWRLAANKHRPKPIGNVVGSLVWVPVDGGGIGEGGKGYEYRGDVQHIASETSAWELILAAATREDVERLHHLLVHAVYKADNGALRNAVTLGAWLWASETEDEASYQAGVATRVQRLTITTPITCDLSWVIPSSTALEAELT